MKTAAQEVPRYRLELAEVSLRYYKSYQAIVRALGSCLAYGEGDTFIPLKTSCHIDAVLVLDSACIRVARIDAALKTLSALDVKILTAFYIEREKGHADRLAGELFYEERNIYRLKDLALARFTEAYFDNCPTIKA